jgi:hypothetical protein
MIEMKKSFVVFSLCVAASCVLFIIFLATGIWKWFLNTNTEENIRTRIVTPRDAGSLSGGGLSQQEEWDANLSTKVPMEDGEIVISVLVHESEEGLVEDQIAVYRKASDAANQVFVTYFSYDERTSAYKRAWNAQTAAARPETISLFSQDLIGDRSRCIIVAGMNAKSEHTMTIFRKSQRSQRDAAFKKIAELQIDGSIVIQETGRSLAYQQGIANGHSFPIAAYGHDGSSRNILDQLETVYVYNQAKEQYEQSTVTRIPGSQVEQRRLREILSGTPGVFENFINDLWYYVSPQGTVDSKQYLYFDPAAKEIIFFGDETQQVFLWQNSSPTRYGLYIRSQNISISTLLRFLDIELESLDSIKLRVFEDVRLKITVSTSWDGSYRRASAVSLNEPEKSIKPAINALYDSSWGRLQFLNTGEYTLNSGGTARKGRYVFFSVEEYNLLELRPEQGESSPENRMVYRIDPAGNAALSLSRVRLGTMGIQDMLETPITLTPVN